MLHTSLRLGSRLCLSLCVLSGCVQSDTTIDIVFDACAPLNLALDATSTQRERDSAANASMMWNAVAATQLTVLEKTDGSQLPVHFQDASPLSYGVYEDEVGEIFVNSNIEDDYEQALTIAHEVGHAFGLLHISGRASIMNPGLPSVAPNAEDAAALVELWSDCGSGAIEE